MFFCSPQHYLFFWLQCSQFLSKTVHLIPLQFRFHTALSSCSTIEPHTSHTNIVWVPYLFESTYMSPFLFILLVWLVYKHFLGCEISELRLTAAEPGSNVFLSIKCSLVVLDFLPYYFPCWVTISVSYHCVIISPFSVYCVCLSEKNGCLDHEIGKW